VTAGSSVGVVVVIVVPAIAVAVVTVAIVVVVVIVALAVVVALFVSAIVGAFEGVDESPIGLDFLLELVWIDNVERVLLVRGALSRAEVVLAHVVDPAGQTCVLVAHELSVFRAEFQKLLGVEVSLLETPHLVKE
jgi:hypothetical protein